MIPEDKNIKVFSIDQYFVLTDQNNKHYLYRIEDVDGLVFTVKNTLQPNQSIPLTSSDVLQPLIPPQGQMYAFRIGVWGYVNVTLYQPSSKLKLSPNGVVSTFNQDISPIEDPSWLTFVVTWPNTSMQVVVSNANPLNISQPFALRFIGYKYRVNQIAQIIQETSGEYVSNLVTREVPEKIVDRMIDAWLEGSLPEITLKSNI